MRNIKPSPEFIGQKVLAHDGDTTRLGVIIDFHPGDTIFGPHNLVRFSEVTDIVTYPSQPVFGFHDIDTGYELILQ
jgi:hypothetical protein